MVQQPVRVRRVGIGGRDHDDVVRLVDDYRVHYDAADSRGTDRRLGALRLSLQTEVGNSAALALYRSLGFTLTEGYVPLSLAL